MRRRDELMKQADLKVAGEKESRLVCVCCRLWQLACPRIKWKINKRQIKRQIKPKQNKRTYLQVVDEHLSEAVR